MSIDKIELKEDQEELDDYDRGIQEFNNTVSPELPKYEVKQNKKTFKESFNESEIQPLEENYINEVNTSPKYSLEVDPTNIYNFTDTQKAFIKNYCEYNNIPIVAQLCEIDEKEALTIFRMLSVQDEIRRIKLARYHKSFALKTLTLNEIGGYLTAIVMDEVPISDRINSNSKMKAVELLIKINDMKSKVINDPTIIDTINIEDQIKDLSINSIQQLIVNANNPSTVKNQIDNNKEDIICQIQEQNDTKLTPEELSELRAMSLDSLLEILNNMTNTKN